VSETSSARIGANSFDDNAIVAPNVIQNNQGHGILVTRNSQARITGNTISNNGDDGVNVARLSQADTASNVINSNGASGINANDNSVVNLGEDNPANFADLPNQTTANNGTFGIRCRGGSQIRGHLGASNQLNGNTSQFGGGSANTFHASCPTPATSLLVP
jgi:parallel beta-helix repeat protein